MSSQDLMKLLGTVEFDDLDAALGDRLLAGQYLSDEYRIGTIAKHKSEILLRDRVIAMLIEQRDGWLKSYCDENTFEGTRECDDEEIAQLIEEFRK